MADKMMHRYLPAILAFLAPWVPLAAAETDSDPVLMGKTRSQWIAQLKDEYPENRIRAITLIGQLGSGAKVAIPELVKCLHDSDKTVRSRTLDAIGTLAATAEEAVPALVKDLENDNAD